MADSNPDAWKSTLRHVSLLYTLELFRVDGSLVIYFKDVQKPFLRPFWISLHIGYDVRLRTDAFVPMKELQVGTKSAAVYSRNHEVAYEPRTVLDVVLAKGIVSGACLTPHTASAVWRIGQLQIRVSMQSRTRLQLMQGFQLIERFIHEKLVLSHGYV